MEDGSPWRLGWFAMLRMHWLVRGGFAIILACGMGAPFAYYMDWSGSGRSPDGGDARAAAHRVPARRLDADGFCPGILWDADTFLRSQSADGWRNPLSTLPVHSAWHQRAAMSGMWGRGFEGLAAMKWALSRKNLWERIPAPLKSFGGRLLGILPPPLVLGGRFRRTLCELGQSQFWPVEKIREYQVDQLRRLCTLAANQTAYYRETFRATGFDPRQSQES